MFHATSQVHWSTLNFGQLDFLKKGFPGTVTGGTSRTGKMLVPVTLGTGIFAGLPVPGTGNHKGTNLVLGLLAAPFFEFRHRIFFEDRASVGILLAILADPL